ncbi:MAG: biotin carboxylase N-terminal domain-containing protein [Acidobacteriota bacterium]
MIDTAAPSDEALGRGATLLIANRGEIAVRIARTARRLGFRVAGIATRADARSTHRDACDVCIDLGDDPRAYLDVESVVDAARRAGATWLHPGYGFLAENAELARACAGADLRFVGPRPDTIEAMADKARARARAEAAGVPCLPASAVLDDDVAGWRDAAERVGLPLLVKAVAGGGGRGQRAVEAFDDLDDAVRAARRESQAAFGDDRVFLERRLDGARHIEVQVLGDGRGGALHLGARDCSIQRRRQKLLEETPPPGLAQAALDRLCQDAVELTRSLDYLGAGTVEMLVDPAERAVFLEMNTRLQVEHAVTEAVHGLDLVAWQLRLAAGRPLPAAPDPNRRGHAIEVRLCLEDPWDDFRPSPGRIIAWRAPDNDASAGLRVDHALADGLAVPDAYDSMVAKVVAFGATRAAAIERLRAALRDTVLLGPTSNLGFLRRLLAAPSVQRGGVDVGWVERGGDGELSLERPRPGLGARAAAAIAASETWGDPAGPLWGFRSSPGWGGWPIDLRAGGEEDAADQPDDSTLHLLPLESCAPGRPRRYRVTGADAADVALEAGPDPIRRRLTVDGETRRIAIAVEGAAERLHAVHLDTGEDIVTLRPPARRAARAAHGDPRLVRAPMAGRLTSIAVTVGDSVAAGDTLATLEAMKLETPLRAQLGGTVSTIHAAVGQQVAQHGLVVEIEPLEADAQTEAG